MTTASAISAETLRFACSAPTHHAPVTYTAMKHAGLDMRCVERMKEALCKYLRLRPGFSRRDLSAVHWHEAASGIEFELIRWA